MMNLPTEQELRTLIERREGPCVSIFIPTRRSGPEAQQNPIRLRNMLRQAEERLVVGGRRAPEARKLLQPAQDLLENRDFWRHQGDGLALFISPELFDFYRSPSPFEEMLVVADRFHVKPLLPVLSSNGRFYVLALSQNEVRLIEGTRYSVNELQLTQVPASLAEALQYTEREKQLQFHTRTSTGQAGRAAMFHGQGAGSDEEAKTRILEYFQQVDKGLQEVFQEQRVPLVLAGVDYLLPIYREATGYRYLLSEAIEGNPDELSAAELHDRAWGIVWPFFEQAHHEAFDRYYTLSDGDHVSKDLNKIIPAAYYGQIDTLFVAVGCQRWGRFDPSTTEVALHAEQLPGDEDLLDFAAIHTLLHGGSVHATEPEKVPDHTELAAIFRWKPPVAQ